MCLLALPLATGLWTVAMAGTALVSPRTVVAVITAVKLLLIPSYHSTDFEVHRNWMAITDKLNLRRWYLDATSQWTLDYPPLFAWFELALAQVAKSVEPAMLTVRADPYISPSTKMFMRLSVIASDFVLLAAVLGFCWGKKNPGGTTKALFLCFGSVSLLMIDHIHFQYNGMLLGVLISSLAAEIHGSVLVGGVLFAVLLNLKHLYLILAPVQFVYILRSWVWGRAWRGRLLAMGGVVVLVFVASLGPIAWTGQLLPMIQRLFPFQRGLLHAYWAPNIWALYAALDKALGVILKVTGKPNKQNAGTSSGLVQETVFWVLPQVSARVAAIATLLSMLPCLVSLWRRPGRERVVRACAYAAMCGFMFGFHVHEKASLTFVLLLGLEAFESMHKSREFILVSTAATYSILPLLYRQEEYMTKLLLLALHVSCVWLVLGGRLGRNTAETAPGAELETQMLSPAIALHHVPELFTAGLVATEIYCSGIHTLIFGYRLSFLPLMFTSVYCSVGMWIVWFGMAAEYCLER